MTYQEAIEILKDLKIYDDDCPTDCEALDLAISALEKQIPKKVIPKEDPVKILVCPECNAFQNDVNHYCDRCGQALAWWP